MKPSTPRHALSLLALVIALCTAGASAASAEGLPRPAEPAAHAHLDAGNKAFDEAKGEVDSTAKQDKYREAIREYMAGLAVETKFHYTFYWNLGHAHRQLGEYTRAQFFYGKFLEFAPVRFVDYRTAAEDFRRMMQAELEKAAAAEEAAALAASRTGGSSTTGTQETAESSSRTPVLDAPMEIAPRWYSDRVGWGLVGVGVGGALVGGGLLQNSSSLFEQANSEDRQSVKADLEDRARSRRTIGLIAGGVGLASLGAGVIKLAITGPSRSKRTPVHVTVGPLSLSIHGSF